MKASILVAFIAILAVGCSTVGSVMNPYKDDFQCPKVANGKCVTVTEAYEESIGISPWENPSSLNGASPLTTEQAPSYNADGEWDAFGSSSSIKQKKKSKNNPPTVSITITPEALYQKRVYEEMAGLIENPKTPIISPPRIIRVMFLPYTNGDSKSLYANRYVFFILDEPRWILDGYINKDVQ